MGERDIDMDMDDALEEMNNAEEIERDIAMDMNRTDDYDDGDPWGEELENDYDYD